jgi:hypothetical protein
MKDRMSTSPTPKTVDTSSSSTTQEDERQPINLLPCVQEFERRKRRKPLPRRYAWWQRIIRRIFGRR